MKIPRQIRENGNNNPSGRKCSIRDCNNDASRTVSEVEYSSHIKSQGYSHENNRNKKLYLCRHHYSKFNKTKSRKERFITKKGFLENSLPYKDRTY